MNLRGLNIYEARRIKTSMNPMMYYQKKYKYYEVCKDINVEKSSVIFWTFS